MSRHAINLLVALPAEAKPLIQNLTLKRLQPDGPCPLYTGAGLSLVVSGVGRDAMTRAIHYLHGRSETECHWLNVGIAGHASLSLGACLQATCIIDVHSGMRWPLKPVGGLEVAHGELRCVNEAETVYAEAMGYDMESGAFVAALSALGLLDHAHVLKIISDNPRQPTERINARMVSQLIAQQCHVIQSLIEKLR
jgi:adenosylhomocysteine nucleosidase